MNDSGLVSRWRSWAPYLLSLLRIVAAFLFMQVGTAKLFAFPGAIMPGGGTAPIGSLAWTAGVLETFGGLFLLVGLFTRLVAPPRGRRLPVRSGGISRQAARTVRRAGSRGSPRRALAAALQEARRRAAARRAVTTERRERQKENQRPPPVGPTARHRREGEAQGRRARRPRTLEGAPSRGCGAAAG